MGTKAILTQYLKDTYKIELSKDYIIFEKGIILTLS